MSNIIESGMIKNQVDKQLYTYCISRLDERHLDAMAALQDIVLQSLPTPELLAKSSAETMLQNLGDQGITLGLFVDDVLKGYASMHFFTHDPEGKQTDISFQHHVKLSPEEITKAAYYKQSAIHPDFRGNSLLKRMARLLVKAALAANPTIRYLCSTVSPLNPPSLKQQFEDGMVAVDILKNRYGWCRLVFFQDILEPLRLTAENAVVADCNDVGRLAELLHSGYCGMGIRQEGARSELLLCNNCRQRSYGGM